MSTLDGSFLLPFPRPGPSRVRITHYGPSLTGGHGPCVNSSHALMAGLMTSAVSLSWIHSQNELRPRKATDANPVIPAGVSK